MRTSRWRGVPDPEVAHYSIRTVSKESHTHPVAVNPGALTCDNNPSCELGLPNMKPRSNRGKRTGMIAIPNTILPTILHGPVVSFFPGIRCLNVNYHSLYLQNWSTS
jgi:hypothetical protein